MGLGNFIKEKSASTQKLFEKQKRKQEIDMHVNIVKDRVGNATNGISRNRQDDAMKAIKMVRERLTTDEMLFKIKPGDIASAADAAAYKIAFNGAKLYSAVNEEVTKVLNDYKMLNAAGEEAEEAAADAADAAADTVAAEGEAEAKAEGGRRKRKSKKSKKSKRSRRGKKQIKKTKKYKKRSNKKRSNKK